MSECVNFLNFRLSVSEKNSFDSLSLILTKDYKNDQGI
jgi:hypothetical protein